MILVNESEIMFGRITMKQLILCCKKFTFNDIIMKQIIIALIISAITTTNIMAQQIIENRFRKAVKKEIVQTAGRDALGEFAPEFARLNDDILFGEVWAATTFCRCATAVSSRLPRLYRRASRTVR